MNEPSAPSRTAPPRWVARVPAYAGVTVCAIGLLILVGWMRHFSALGGHFDGLPRMKVNSALAMALAGVSLLGPRVLRWAALLPLAIGVLTLAEWISGHGLGIDEVLVRDTFASVHPGRTSPQTAAALLVFALARLLSGSRHAQVRRAGGALTAVFGCMVLVLELGWIFQAPELTSAHGGTGISFMGALCIGLLALGLGAVHAARRPLTYLWDTGIAGTLVRRLLPAVLLAPPLLGLLRLLGQQLGWYGLHLGTALFAGSMMLLLAVVVTVTAQSIHRLDTERSHIARELQAIFDSVPAGLTMRDPEGRLVRYNRARRTGPDGSEISLGGFSRPPLGRNVAELAAQEAAALEGGRPVTRSYGPTDEGHDYEITKFPVYDADGSVLGIGGFALDVTARVRAERALREAEQRARQLAERDPLTAIWNRRWFEAELGAVLEQLSDERADGALLIVDVDHFKAVNDTSGHHAGDRLLVAVAEALSGTVGEDGSVSRIGGDEFAVILHRGDRDRVESIAGLIGGAVAESAERCGPDTGAGTTRTTSVSIGVALFADLPRDERTRRDALIRADEALYAAKRAGRGRHRCYTPELARGA